MTNVLKSILIPNTGLFGGTVKIKIYSQITNNSTLFILQLVIRLGLKNCVLSDHSLI